VELKEHQRSKYCCCIAARAEDCGIVEQTLVDDKPRLRISRVQSTVGALLVHQVSHYSSGLAHNEAIIVNSRHLLLRVQLGELFRFVFSSCQVYDFYLKRKLSGY
jgi:hypothetical protein